MRYDAYSSQDFLHIYFMVDDNCMTFLCTIFLLYRYSDHHEVNYIKARTLLTIKKNKSLVEFTINVSSCRTLRFLVVSAYVNIKDLRHRSPG